MKPFIYICSALLLSFISSNTGTAAAPDLGKLVQDALQSPNQSNYSADQASLFTRESNNSISIAVIQEAENEALQLPGTDKIDRRLRKLMAQARSEGFYELEESAESKGVAMTDNMVSVTLTGKSEYDLQGLESKVLELGGQLMISFENNLYVRMPLHSLEQLGEESSLFYLAPQAMILPEPPPVVDDSAHAYEQDLSWDAGVKATGADILHQKHISGKGVKVGIIDPGGFAGYDTLEKKGILPKPAAFKNFKTGREPNTNIDREGVHGTACAEIIHTMAPEASLYLAEMKTNGELMQATTWMVEHGVQIISYSAGNNSTTQNGDSTLDRFIKDLSEKHNLLFIAAAGNSGQTHWMNTVMDKNSDGFIDVIYPKHKEKISDHLLIQAKGQFRAIAKWDDWGSDPTKPTPTIDLDLYLIEVKNNKQVVIAKSTNRQNGRGNPVEIVQGTSDSTDNTFFLAAKINGQTKENMRLHIFLDGRAAIYPHSSPGSISSPASGRDTLTVGAINVADGKLANYSSQGKTDDGRIKPEISAPAGTRSHAYELTSTSKESFLNQPDLFNFETKADKGPFLFHGTSASCPHVAGAAALIKGIYPDANRKKIWQLLTDSAKPMGDKIPNSHTGYGYLNVAEITADKTNSDPQQTRRGQGDPTVEQLLQNILH